MEDEILKEMWAVKDRIAARYRGNIKKYMDDLRAAHANSPLANAGPQKPVGKPKAKSGTPRVSRPNKWRESDGKATSPVAKTFKRKPIKHKG